MLAVHARLQGDKLAAQDHSRSMSFALWNERACRLANALLGLGLSKGDRVGILAYNSVEWLEIYAALAKAGLIAVPINFRLVGKEVQYILENAGASALIVQDQLLDLADDVRARLGRTTMHFINYGANANPAGYLSYEDLITSARSVEPDVSVNASDPATLIYTSGTTGNPKGVLHSHKNTAMLALVTGMELKIHRDDNALLVMPMCHGNSLYFYYSFAYAGATTTVHSRKSFDPGDCLKALSSTQATFTSLVPTQYIAMLGLSDAEKNKHQLDHVDRLMISSAPARLETKQATMEMFPNSGLY